MKIKLLVSTLLLFPVWSLAASHMASDRISDILNTKHNFAVGDVVELPGAAANADGRNVKAVSQKETCVFCHTPHGDPQKAGQNRPFLWNRSLSNQVYTEMYASSSLNATSQNLGTGSRMCLSCHDGTVAIGQVEVVNGRLTRAVGGIDAQIQSGTIEMTGANLDADGSLKEDSGGYTSNLGQDLSNDHPLGFVYNTQLATTDGELQDPAASTELGVRIGNGIAQFNQSLVNAGGTQGTNPVAASTRVALPLEPTVSDARIANNQTTFVSVAAEGSVQCTTCHDPHIRSTNTEENIKFLRLHRTQKSQPVTLATGSSEPGFVIDEDINCVACHKKTGWSSSVHAQSANTYKADAAALREFPTDTTVWEASCLNCHDPHTETGANWLLRSGADGSSKSAIEQTCYECHGPTPVVNDDGGKAPADIQTLDALSGHEAFDSATTTGTQLHNIQSADMDETQQNLKNNRHITCSDCHNPHRILQNALHDGSGESGSSLHAHKDGVVHSNKLSGALNGVAGVRADSSAVTTFEPYNAVSGIVYTELKGVVDQTASNAADVVTKEYQVCMKCHSDYSDTTIGATRANIAMEFSEAAISAHPVVVSSNDNAQVGKADISKTNAENLVTPFNQGLGTQTMYCSDCHTSNVPANPKGPHGSAVDKLLAAEGDNLCASCHKADQYQTAGGSVQNSGFSCQTTDCTVGADTNNNNLHILHASVASGGVNVCGDCHVKVPHGWRNKALLADIDEADPDNLKARYYPNAKIDINDGGIPLSGAWTKADCTAAGCH